MWPATIILGPSVPSLAIKEPRLSVTISAAKSTSSSRRISWTSPSKPDTPGALLKSSNSCNESLIFLPLQNNPVVTNHLIDLFYLKVLLPAITLFSS